MIEQTAEELQKQTEQVKESIRAAIKDGKDLDSIFVSRVEKQTGMPAKDICKLAIELLEAKQQQPPPPEQPPNPQPVADLFADYTPEEEKEFSAVADPLPLVPTELKAKPNWIRWKLEDKGGNPTKVPYQLNGNHAASNNPATWVTYDAIINNAVLSQTEGIGIMTDGTWVGFDLDGCRNPATGEIAEWAKRIINLLGTYTEITPSGCGARVYVNGRLPDGHKSKFSLGLSAGFGSKVQIECYDKTRYFTVTGNRVGDQSVIQASDDKIAQAYALCADISREYPSEKQTQATQFGGSDSTSGVTYTKKQNSVLTSKLAVLMYGTIQSTNPFMIEDDGGIVTAPTPSEADMSLATLLAMKYGDDPDAIWDDYTESALARPKWLNRKNDFFRLTIAKAIAKAIAAAKEFADKGSSQATSTAQAPPDAATEASKDAEGTFPLGEETIPEFDDTVITGSFRKLVDAICNGTTIPRQYGLHATKALACSILTTYKIELEDCESARSYFIVFGDTGTGKGLSFRRLQQIVEKTDFAGSEYVKIIHAVDSEAGLRDAFFEIPTNKNRPILYFVDEIKTLGHKADGKKNPEIIDAIIELANNPTVSRTKSKKTVKAPASKTRPDSWLLTFMCAQDGEAYATAFPRTKTQGLPDRFIPEYSPKVVAGRLPMPDLTAGVTAILELLRAKTFGHMTMTAEVKKQVDEVWNGQPLEFQQSPRLRQQFLLELYLAAFSRGSAIADQQDLAIAVRTLDRQKAIRKRFFTEEIPNQVGVYSNRLKTARREMQHRLRRGAAVGDIAMSLPQLMTHTLAYKENDLPNFNLAWKSQVPLWVEIPVVSQANGHVYKKWVPMPEESDTWLSVELLPKGKMLGA